MIHQKYIKVKCVSVLNTTSETLGKWYDVIEQTHDYYLICDNTGSSIWVCKIYYETKYEVREANFKKLGII